MKTAPILIENDMKRKCLKRISAETKAFSEKWLQDLLQDHPQILPVDEIEPVFTSLTSIGREISVPTGFIDNLFISKAGYLVLVETKLWRNPQAKREVLAQAIDYAAEISKWSFQQLDDIVKRYHHIGVIELLQTNFDMDADEIPAEETIINNIRNGRFLILIVSDHIRRSLIEILEYINKYPHLAANVGLVELQCYTLPDNQGDILVVPSLLAKTEIVERTVVQIQLKPDIDYQISSEQIESHAENQKRTALSEEAYWSELHKNSPKSVESARVVFRHFDGFPQVQLRLRKAAITARLTLPYSDIQISLFFIDTQGRVTCWPKVIIAQLENGGINTEYGERYESELTKILIKGTGKQAIYEMAQNINVDSFFNIVDRFITDIFEASGD